MAFAVLVVATVFTSTVISRIADEHDQRLLEERTGEVAVFLELYMGEVEMAFPYLAGVLQVAADPARGFELAAGSLVGDSVRGIGMVEPMDGGYRAVATVGDGPAAGAAVGDEWASLLSRAVTEGDVVTGVLPGPDGEGTRVGLAYGTGGVPVLFFMELFFDPRVPVEQGPGSPFSDITGSVYVGLEARPSNLVLTTTNDLPLEGDIVRDTFPVGADEWLVLTTTDGSLTGPLAEQTRWGVLAGGLVLALLTATIIEILGRRRVYALRLVEERTAELREARQVAEDANRSKSEFLSRMSHELRTPLNAVLGFGQLLEMDPLDAPQQEAVGQILKGGRHLLDLINEVLDISRIEAGELALSPEPVHVPELVQEAVDLIRPLADQSGIQVVVDRSTASDVYAFADRQRAKQVLLNLLSNAVKYNRARGTVSVSCEKSTETLVRISVTDTGPGIPAERIGQLFTAFERLGAENTGVEGTGIGLALSMRLAQAMGGTLTVETALGRGSTFSVELPRVEGPLERYERLTAGAEAAGAPAGEQRHVVLHIEDNLSNAALVERIFGQRPDVEVIPAMQGRLGLELAREHQPILVLLDLHLPDMSGEQVLQRLREDPATASIPVVIVSADATPGHVQRLLSAGATAYLTKPIDVPELLATLDAVLTRS